MCLPLYTIKINTASSTRNTQREELVMSEVSRQGLMMDRDLRKQIKLRAVELGISVSQLVATAVKEYLAKEANSK